MNGNELVAGMDLGGTSVKVGLVDGSGSIVSRDVIEIEAAASFERIADTIVRGFRLLKERTPGVLKAIGLGTPGFTDSETGVIVEGIRNIPALEGRSLASVLQKAFSVPVFADNDATCAAAGELYFGAGKGYDHFALITLGTGIGGGLVFGGRVYRGARGFAAEIGHMIIQPQGVRCNCGNYGCFEQYASGPAMLRAYRDRQVKRGMPAEEELTVKQLFERAAWGDREAEATVDETARWIAMVFGLLINLLNPQACIVAGGISRAGEQLLAPIRRYLPDYAWPLLVRGVDVIAAALQNDAGLLGAAAQAGERAGLAMSRRPTPGGAEGAHRQAKPSSRRS